MPHLLSSVKKYILDWSFDVTSKNLLSCIWSFTDVFSLECVYLGMDDYGCSMLSVYGPLNRQPNVGCGKQ